MNETNFKFDNAVISDDANGLQDIHIKTKNIAIYHRQIQSLKTALDRVTEQSIEFRASGKKEEIIAALDIYFTKNFPEHRVLLDDTLNLLSLFKKVSNSSSFRFLLATINTNMCRKFHTDINNLRMLCTYAGPGTLWLPEEAVNNKAYRTGGDDKDVVLDQNLIQQVDTGDVVILKGALYPESKAIIHRSPTIEETGKKRLLLRIDTNESVNFWK
ncbi:MAG: DUF1826 domain-containing protein [Saprospiraceae bacterium]|nr:DUF1826 domain-containing protein [Saprospiraceae bacterium]